jgi:hypothetical protein
MQRESPIGTVSVLVCLEFSNATFYLLSTELGSGTFYPLVVDRVGRAMLALDIKPGLKREEEQRE